MKSSSGFLRWFSTFHWRISEFVPDGGQR